MVSSHTLTVWYVYTQKPLGVFTTHTNFVVCSHKPFGMFTQTLWCIHTHKLCGMFTHTHTQTLWYVHKDLLVCSHTHATIRVYMHAVTYSPLLVLMYMLLMDTWNQNFNKL